MLFSIVIVTKLLYRSYFNLNLTHIFKVFKATFKTSSCIEVTLNMEKMSCRWLFHNYIQVNGTFLFHVYMEDFFSQFTFAPRTIFSLYLLNGYIHFFQWSIILVPQFLIFLLPLTVVKPHQPPLPTGIPATTAKDPRAISLEL